MRLKKLNSRWKIKMKIMIYNIVQWSSQKRNRLRQEQIEGKEEEKERKVPQQKRPQLREKGKEKNRNWMKIITRTTGIEWITWLKINWSPLAACDKMESRHNGERKIISSFVFLWRGLVVSLFLLCNHHQVIPTHAHTHWTQVNCLQNNL